MQPFSFTKPQCHSFHGIWVAKSAWLLDTANPKWPTCFAWEAWACSCSAIWSTATNRHNCTGDYAYSFFMFFHVFRSCFSLRVRSDQQYVCVCVYCARHVWVLTVLCDMLLCIVMWSVTCQAHGRRCVPFGVCPPLLWATEKLATSKG